MCRPGGGWNACFNWSSIDLALCAFRRRDDHFVRAYHRYLLQCRAVGENEDAATKSSAGCLTFTRPIDCIMGQTISIGL